MKAWFVNMNFFYIFALQQRKMEEAWKWQLFPWWFLKKNNNNWHSSEFLAGKYFFHFYKIFYYFTLSVYATLIEPLVIIGQKLLQSIHSQASLEANSIPAESFCLDRNNRESLGARLGLYSEYIRTFQLSSWRFWWVNTDVCVVWCCPNEI